MTIDALMFLAIPLVIGACFVLSFFFRKKQKILWSVLIQLAPILYTFMTFGILFLLVFLTDFLL